MRAYFLQEPELEFGGGGRHIDIRFGLTTFGPLDRSGDLAPRAVRVGLVGDSESIDLFSQWVSACRDGVEAKQSSLTNLYPRFPGFGHGGAFCDFLCPTQLTRPIPRRELDELAGVEPRRAMVENSVTRYLAEVESLIDHANIDVVVCLLSPVLLKRIDITAGVQKGPRSQRETPDDINSVVWHDLLKAKAMRLRRPVQVIRPATYGGKVHRYRQDGTATADVQDDATRAWNVFTALYYKAGGVPWRVIRDTTELTTCFVGVSFFWTSGQEALQTSVAQVFNERGEGIIVRGGQARISKEDLAPHLNEEDSAGLLTRALELYRSEHRTLPARLVIHKSSQYSDEEKRGFESAAKAARVDGFDLLSLRKGFTRAYRLGAYPPLRGTVLELSGRESLLYTHGSVDFYQCYPGLYVPRPLHVRFDDTEQGTERLLSQILALSKMNWNSTQFINAEPITLTAARSVGDILRYLPEAEPVQARYSYYM